MSDVDLDQELEDMKALTELEKGSSEDKEEKNEVRKCELFITFCVVLNTPSLSINTGRHNIQIIWWYLSFLPRGLKNAQCALSL